MFIKQRFAFSFVSKHLLFLSYF